jgi:hypothetical protein
MPIAGDYYCNVCMMPFEDNAHLQRHLGSNKHINTLLKKRGINIDEVDMDEIVDITKLSREELRQYVRNTDRYKELCGEVVDKWNGLWNRIREIDRIIGKELVCTRDGDGSGDEADDYESRVKANLYIDPTIESRVPIPVELSFEERRSLLEEKELLICQCNDMERGSKGDQIGKATTYAFETTVKELRAEYQVFEKSKEKRLEKEKKEAERQAEKDRKEAERQAEKDRKEAERQAEKDRKEAERQAEKDRREADRKRRQDMTTAILQARMIGLLNQ